MSKKITDLSIIKKFEDVKSEEDLISFIAFKNKFQVSIVNNPNFPGKNKEYLNFISLDNPSLDFYIGFDSKTELLKEIPFGIKGFASVKKSLINDHNNYLKSALIEGAYIENLNERILTNNQRIKTLNECYDSLIKDFNEYTKLYLQNNPSVSPKKTKKQNYVR